MMKYFIIFSSIVAGIFLGQFQTVKTIKLEKSFSHSCKPIDRNNNKLGKEESFSCPLIIPNMGILHNRSEAVSRSKIYAFFSSDLRKFYDNPNEFNVHTNDSAAGSSAQKYDPREDLYVRFNRTNKFDKKVDYGVVKKFMTPEKCHPSFVLVDNIEKSNFYNLLKYVDSKISSKYDYRSSRLSFLSYATADRSYMSGDDGLLLRYKLFRNTCSKAVSVILNFCFADPRYDLQYEDMFVLENGGRAQSVIYCKKSGDKDWTVISKAEFRLASPN